MNLYELIQYVQRSRNYNNNFTAISSTKLNEEAQLAISIGDVTPIEITLMDLTTAIAAGTLSPGAYYLISGVCGFMFGGTTVLLQALTTNTLAVEGFGQFYNPNYLNFSMWSSINSYEISQVACYGGYAWTNLTGVVGTSIDEFNLDGTNWLKINTSDSVYYNTVWDAISYDFVNDYIVSRYEAANNNLVQASILTMFWFETDYSPIQVFKWGTPTGFDNSIFGCRITESYFDCLNIVSGSIAGITMENYSYFTDLTMELNSYIETLYMANNSYITGLDINNSGIYSLKLANNSSFNDVSLDNCQVYDVSLDNYSTFYEVLVNPDSYVQYVTLDNDSTISNCTITGSSLEGIYLNNYSDIAEITMTDSTMYCVSLDNGVLTYLTLSGSSSFNETYMRDSYITELTMISGSQLYNLDMVGVLLNYNNIGTLTNVYINGVIAHTNTIKYQYSLSFNGSTNQGAVGSLIMPFMFVPSGYYFERAILDGVNVTNDNSSTVLQIGLGNGLGNEAINSTVGLVPNWGNSVVCADISNLQITPTKAISDTVVAATVSVGDLTGGTLYGEIIIKNTNIISNND